MLETVIVYDDDEAQHSLDANELNDQDEIKCYICIRCGRNCNDLSNLVQHKRYDFCVDDKRPECRLCNEKLPTLKDLDHHLENSHNRFTCDKSFNTLAKYNKHQSYHEKFICDICSHLFYTKRSLRQHLISHTQGN